MAPLPEPSSPTRDAIFAAYEADRDDGFRPHLGASQIGKSCARALWYDFRWATPARFAGRILRLFETGQLEEARLVRNLRRTGATVLEVDPETGRQWRVEAHGGHFGGSLDAVALGLLEAPKTWHVVEFKTHSAKSFRELVAKGVAQAKPQHWAQMQVYMALTGLTRAIYLAVCKDTDDLHVERVRADRDAAERLLGKAERVIFAARPPSKISEDPAWWECRFCDHDGVCHESEAPAVTCRSCLHSSPVDGGWHCARWDQALDLDAQRRGCAKHLFVPDLVPGTRLAPGKTDCLVLDFAGNVARHGPIDAVKPKKPGTGAGDAPVKTCPDCQSLLATAVRVCPDCGHAFPAPEVAIETKASTLEILSSGKPQWLDVTAIRYSRHEKPGGRPSLRVDYHCGLVRHSEWVCLEHTGYARQKAIAWWRRRAPGRPSRRASMTRSVRSGTSPSRTGSPSGRAAASPRSSATGSRYARPALCAVCRRQPRGIGWFDARYAVSDPRRHASERWFCGTRCLELFRRRRGMIDPTPNEKAAMAAGGTAAGEYLESLGRSDLAQLSVPEWQTLIEVIVTGYCDALRDFAARDQELLESTRGRIPF